MLLEITEKIVGENAFEQKKKKPGLNLIGLRTTWPRCINEYRGHTAAGNTTMDQHPFQGE